MHEYSDAQNQDNLEAIQKGVARYPWLGEKIPKKDLQDPKKLDHWEHVVGCILEIADDEFNLETIQALSTKELWALPEWYCGSENFTSEVKDRDSPVTSAAIEFLCAHIMHRLEKGLKDEKPVRK